MGIPTIKIENEKGEVLNLSADPRYMPILTGTGPPGATINRSKVGTVDGTRYNSATVNERNLLLTVYIQRDVARARRNLYRWLGSKQYIKVYYQEDDLDVYSEGYVDDPNVNPWENQQNLSASIICPMPYWRDVRATYTDASIIKSLLEFPMATEADGIELSIDDKVNSAQIYNNGTAESGLTMVLEATTRTVNPKIYIIGTGEFIGFDVELTAGDRLEVCTIDGQKSVVHVRDGVRSNYINTVMDGHTWLKLPPGVTEMSYTKEDGECKLGVYHTNMYIGV